MNSREIPEEIKESFLNTFLGEYLKKLFEILWTQFSMKLLERNSKDILDNTLNIIPRR